MSQRLEEDRPHEEKQLVSNIAVSLGGSIDCLARV